MTTQIVASKLNGDVQLAQVETVALALLALAALGVMRRIDPQGRLTGTVRGLAPRPRRIARRWQRWGATAAGWSFSLLVLLPHATLLLISFVPAHSWTVEPLPPVLDLSNYAALAGDAARLRPVATSLWMALAATAGALLLGFAAARAALAQGGRLGAALEALLALPWAIPGTVFAIALATTFSVQAPLTGRFVLVGTAALLPLAYLVRDLPLTGRAALAGLRQLDPALEEASASLGAGRGRTLARVVLPLVRPALVAGAGLAFITALGDFVTSIVLYTYDTRPISIEILSNLRLQEVGIAAVYGVLLMLASTAAFLLWGRGGEVG
jgi:iron(III) transport system permease protein